MDWIRKMKVRDNSYHFEEEVRMIKTTDIINKLTITMGDSRVLHLTSICI